MRHEVSWGCRDSLGTGDAEAQMLMFGDDLVGVGMRDSKLSKSEP